MKILFLILCAIATLSVSALADWTAAQRYYYTHTTYEQRYGHPRFTKEELAQRQREDADYERNKDLYDKLDDIEAQLETLNEGQQDQEDTQPQTRVQTLADYTNASPDRVEVGQFFTRSGHRVIALYEINEGQCTQANLIMPDGSKIKVDIEKGTKPAVIDQSLQRIVDKQ